MRLLVLVLALGCAPAVPPGHDWPMFGRDKERNAVSPERNPPTDGSGMEGKERNVAWKGKLGSMCFTPPIVSDGLVWIGTNRFYGGEDVLLCFRECDGALLWRYESMRPRGKGSWYWRGYPLRHVPLVEQDRLWLINNLWQMICLDLRPLKDGTGEPRELWTIDLVERVGTWPRSPYMGIGLSGSIGGSTQGMLYVSTGHADSRDPERPKGKQIPAVVCLDKETGEILGREGSGITGRSVSPEVSSPVVGSLGGGKSIVIYGAGDGFLYGFDATPSKDTGILGELWRVDCNPAPFRHGKNPRPYGLLGTPVIHEGRVYAAIGEDEDAGDGNLCCVELKSGKLLWNSTGIGLTTSTPVVAEGQVFVSDRSGFVRALDASTGQLEWTYDALSGIVTSPLLVDGNLYVATGDGDVAVLDVRSRKKGSRTPSHILKFDDSIYASPVFANGTLYVAVAGWLYAIRQGNTGPLPRDELKGRRIQGPDVPFLPTPRDVVKHMLDLAEARGNDVLYDLGSGDGRVVIAAARDVPCKAVGVEIDDSRVAESRESIRKEGLEKRASIEQGDLLQADLSQASVVTLYVGRRLNGLLVPKLQTLRPGARVVSHNYEIPGVKADAIVKVVSSEDGREHTLYLWKIGGAR